MRPDTTLPTPNGISKTPGWRRPTMRSSSPSLLPRVEANEADLLARLGTTAGAGSRSGPQALVLTTRFRSPHGELAFFSMFTTFGTPNDITLASLPVEPMVPADEATRAV